jgi:hypothetical protein
LTYTCNKSLSTGIFSIQLKFSVVKPLYNKVDRTSLSNFGLISLLTSFSKILKKVIYSRLHQHIQYNNILANEQYGCTHNSSTERTSYKLLDSILSGLNNNLVVGGIFCDLKKAFV